MDTSTLCALILDALKKIMLKITLLLILSLFVISCTAHDSQKEKVMKGHLVFGHEVRSFKPSDSDKTYWLIDASDDDIWDKYKSFNKAPYQPIYAEIKVVKSERSDIGFAQDYDGIYEVKDLIKISAEVSTCNN